MLYKTKLNAITSILVLLFKNFIKEEVEDILSSVYEELFRNQGTLVFSPNKSNGYMREDDPNFLQYMGYIKTHGLFD